MRYVTSVDDSGWEYQMWEYVRYEIVFEGLCLIEIPFFFWIWISLTRDLFFPRACKHFLGVHDAEFVR